MAFMPPLLKTKQNIKSAARVLNRHCFNKKGLDLSKNILWVSVGQRAADLQAVKVGGQKKILPFGQLRAKWFQTIAISITALEPI